MPLLSDADEVAQSIIAYDEFLNGAVAKFIQNSSAIGGDVQTQVSSSFSFYRFQSFLL